MLEKILLAMTKEIFERIKTDQLLVRKFYLLIACNFCCFADKILKMKIKFTFQFWKQRWKNWTEKKSFKCVNKAWVGNMYLYDRFLIRCICRKLTLSTIDKTKHGEF